MSLLFLSVSLSFFKRQAKKRKKKRNKEWSLCFETCRHFVLQLNKSIITLLTLAALRPSTPSKLKRDREYLKDKAVKANSPSTTDTNNMNPQEIRINYIFFSLSSSSTFVQNIRDRLTSRHFVYMYLHIWNNPLFRNDYALVCINPDFIKINSRWSLYQKDRQQNISTIDPIVTHRFLSFLFWCPDKNDTCVNISPFAHYAITSSSMFKWWK
jgi:hypothetical protein